MGIRLTNNKQLQKMIGRGDSRSKKVTRTSDANDAIMLDERDTKPLEPMEMTQPKIDLL